jgi:toxin ParE1/3/4
MKVVFKNTAIADLEDIVDHISKDSIGAALNLLSEIRENATRIGDFPEAYPVVNRFGGRELRRRVFGNYLIFYRISRGRVEILQVIHGARNINPDRF